MVSERTTLTNTYNFTFYDNWIGENIATFGFHIANANSLTNKNVKLSDRLFLPSRKLRGFENGKVGPKDGGAYIGGNSIATFNASTTMPQIFPNLQSTNFSLFFDAANIWGIDYNSSINDDSTIRTTIGLAIDLYTPVGPLSFTLSEPITKGDNDVEEFFRFNLGTTF